ncbi:hypothetical protein RYX56_24285, partial [Alkalihalophilus lindianensis]
SLADSDFQVAVAADKGDWRSLLSVRIRLSDSADGAFANLAKSLIAAMFFRYVCYQIAESIYVCN